MNNPRHTDQSEKHLSQKQLLRYHADELTAKEMQQVERHLLNCALCSDALEGYALLETPKASAAMKDLKGRFAERLAQEKQAAVPMYWKWAAAAAFLLMITTAAYIIFMADPLDKQPLAQEELQPTTAQDAPIASAPAASNDSLLPSDAPLAFGQPPAEHKPEGVPAESRQVEIIEIPYEVEVAAAPADPAGLSETKPEASEKANNTRSRSASAMPLAAESKKSADTALPTPTVETEMAMLSRKEQNAPIVNSFSNAAPPAPVRMAMPATRELKGKVVDARSGEPLPGVSVQIKGTGTGTLTDINGEYALVVPEGDASLSFNFIGYKSRLLPVTPGTRTLMATLDEEVESLSEVVVTARGATPKKNIGSFTQASPENYQAAQPAKGMKHYRRYLSKNAGDANTAREVVVVSFFVEKDGQLSQFEIISSAGPEKDAEALELLKKGPRWKPARIGDTAIREKVSLSIPAAADR